MKSWRITIVAGVMTTCLALAPAALGQHDHGAEPVFTPSVWGVELPVKDVGRSEAFYREIMGFVSADSYEDREGPTLDNGGLRLVFRRSDAPLPPDGPRLNINLSVPDLKVICDVARRAGATILDDEPLSAAIGTYIRILDPDGNHVHLIDLTGDEPQPDDPPKLYNVGFTVTDMDAAESFYTVLGFEIYSRKYLPDTLPLVPVGAAMIVLHPVEGPALSDDARVSTLLLDTVSDLTSVNDDLRRRGVESVSELWGLELRDPAGNRIRIVRRTLLGLPHDSPSLPGGKRRTDRYIAYDLIVHSTPEEVYELWTTEDGADRFFGEWSVIEGSVGGAYEIYFSPRSEADRKGTTGAKLLSIEPERALSFEWKAPRFADELNTDPLPTWVEVRFDPVASDGDLTHLHLEHHGFQRGGAWDTVYETFWHWWGEILFRLDRLTSTGLLATSDEVLPMSDRAEATFDVESWDEKPFDELEDGPRLSRASVVKVYHGGLDGEGRVEQLAVYRPDGSAVFTALERFRGRLGERAGSFVLRHEGTFVEGKVTSTWVVVPDSSTGDLAGLRGKIRFEHGHAERYPIVFDYWWE